MKNDWAAKLASTYTNNKTEIARCLREAKKAGAKEMRRRCNKEAKEVRAKAIEECALLMEREYGREALNLATAREVADFIRQAVQ